MSGHGCELCGCSSVRNHTPPAATDDSSEMLLGEAGRDPGSKPLHIDLHSHILPKQWPCLSEKYNEPGPWVQLEHTDDGLANMTKGGKFFRKVEPNVYDSETRLREADEYGIDVQVLSTVPVMFSYWAKPENTLDLSKYLNDNISQTVSENSTRYAGLGTLPMNSPELAVKELHRVTDDLGMDGVIIGSNVNGKNLDHESLFPIFEECADKGVGVFVHPWLPMLGEDRTGDYWGTWLVGMPAETTLAICSMIFGGVLERLPNLKVCFAHGGGSFAATLGRIEQGFNVRPDLCAIKNDKAPSEYLGKFWIDSLVHDEFMMRRIVSMFGSNRVCLGTDYPFPLGEYVTTRPGNLIRQTFADRLDLQANLFQNATLEFLGVDEDRFRSE